MSETPTLNGDEKTVVENDLPVVEEKVEASNSNCVSEKKIKKKFNEEDDVLSRWSDGLLYLGTIIKVDEESEKCLVKFEDNSEHWAMFKDLQKGVVQDSDIVCSLCETGESEAPNEIVICDNCGFGFHQCCHNPEIPAEVLQPDFPWLCRQCAILNSTKNGNVLQKSPVGLTMQNLKSFPYDMISLSWDTFHKTNMQQCYCYCGGPGEWYMKMLQCFRCKQWFHEACIQSLEKPMLFGDRFYIFVCAICNGGAEYIHRLEMKWPDVAHLVIYNLTVKHNKKYFDFETGIMPFVERNWSLLQLGNTRLSKTTSEDRRTNVLTALQNNKSRFKCGKEIKKKTTIWGLRVRIPPPPPKFNLPADGVITNEVYKLCKGTRRSKTVNVPLPAISSTTTVSAARKNGRFTGIRKRRREADLLIEAATTTHVTKEEKIAQTRETPRRKNGMNEASITSYKTPFKRKYTRRIKMDDNAVSGNDISGRKKTTTKKYCTIKKKRKCGRPPGQDSSSKGKANRMSCKLNCKSYSTTTSSVRCQVMNRFDNNSSDDDEDTSSHGTLDLIIPPPTNFEGHNHPFRNLELFPVSLSSLARPLKRKLKQTDIRINKNGQIKQRRLKRRRIPYGSYNGYTSRVNEAMSEVSFDTGSELECDSNENSTMEAIQAAKISFHDLKSSVHSYFGAANRIASGERFSVLARRVTRQGKAQFLIDWEGLTA